MILAKRISVITRFKENKYDHVEVIKLSSFIDEYSSKKSDTKEGESLGFTALMNKIKGGYELREKYLNTVLAELAINKIQLDSTIHRK